jgi:hypothetical protein
MDIHELEQAVIELVAASTAAPEEFEVAWSSLLDFVTPHEEEPGLLAEALLTENGILQALRQSYERQREIRHRMVPAAPAVLYILALSAGVFSFACTTPFALLRVHTTYSSRAMFPHTDQVVQLRPTLLRAYLGTTWCCRQTGEQYASKGAALAAGPAA